MAPGEQEVVNLIITDRHYIHVKTWIESGDWWVQTMVDGSLLSLENVGSDTVPVTMTLSEMVEQRRKATQPVPIKKNKRRKR